MIHLVIYSSGSDHIRRRDSKGGALVLTHARKGVDGLLDASLSLLAIQESLQLLLQDIH